MNGQRRSGMHIQLNITQPEKKKEILSFVATWMDLEIVIISEVSQRTPNIT